MIHDWLCPSAKECDCKHCECCTCHSPVWCQCDLIAAVRNDDASASVRRIDEILPTLSVSLTPQDREAILTAASLHGRWGLPEVLRAVCNHTSRPDIWKDETPYCRDCGADTSYQYEMGD